jgi:hypothetical protein
MRAAAVKTHLRIRRLRRLWMRTNNSVCHFPHLPHRTNTISLQQQAHYTSPTLVPPPLHYSHQLFNKQRGRKQTNTKTKKLSSSGVCDLESSPSLLSSDSTKDLFKNPKTKRISPPASAPPPSPPPTLFTGIPGAFEEIMGFSGFWFAFF